jgi:hypothetical protein
MRLLAEAIEFYSRYLQYVQSYVEIDWILDDFNLSRQQLNRLNLELLVAQLIE